MMNIEVAINLVNKLYFEAKGQPINSIQTNLLRGVWFNQSYEEIADNCYCSMSNIKMIGSTFWTELSQILGERVTKKTARAILENYYQERKTGKVRKSLLNHQQKDIFPSINETQIEPTFPKLDPWFSSEILWRMTERLDTCLRTLTSTSSNNLSPLISLSEKLKLLYCLNGQNYSLNRTYLDIIDICRHIIHDLTIQFPHQTIILSLFNEPILSEYDLTVNTLMDKKLIDNILKYLLANALQYSHPNSTITLDINIEDQQAIFTVIDQGIGIPNDELEQVFQPFYCGSNACKKSGDGLGLTIVEKSVRWHQGEISVSSQIEKGSIFTVVLPVV
ncbi:sensor histidine kinase KdpD [Cyanothece sp. BG0011]|uniref:sensor histidine kinase n=1 Tax=Cyanothece sp. BG0011 TaxID=2082950 RepID=UPI0013009EAF|nr:ATP-binding protein [Cyanothece sp. BG0011]